MTPRDDVQMDEERREGPIRGLDDRVAEQVLAELPPDDGPRVLSCLRTAQSLLALGAVDSPTERFAASAAYNLREALDSVTRRRNSAGGLTTALEAWSTYKLACDVPGADEPTARAQLTRTLDRLANDSKRESYRVRNLLELFREQTGAEPLPGTSDASRQYSDLLRQANAGLHDDLPIADAQRLFDDVVAWFVRFFAPPSLVAAQIAELAAAPYSPESLERFVHLGASSHHLRLFLERLQDPGWLGPLWQRDLIGLPRTGEPWPVTALTREPRQLPDGDVAGLLEQMLAAATAAPLDERPQCCWEIMRTAWLLGDAGLEIVLEVLRRYPRDDMTQMVAMAATKQLDPTSNIHLRVANAVLGNEPHRDGVHRTAELLERLIIGATADNIADRFALMSHRLRQLAAAPEARYVALDTAALTVPTEGDRDALLLTARALVRSIGIARRFGMSTSSMLKLVERIPGELGERIVCQVLAGAADIDRIIKVSHLVQRLRSETATGDDDDLVNDLLPFTADEAVELRASLGDPVPAPTDPGRLGENWPKGWRWSAVLPEEALRGWDEAIAEVTARHGEIDPATLHQPPPRIAAAYGSSPISSEDIAALDVIEAATRVAAWRSTPADPWGTSSLELARALQRAVEVDPSRWAADPSAVARALREPIYVGHYLAGLAKGAHKLRSAAPSIVRAIGLARSERWQPSLPVRRPYENNDWTGVDTSAIELIRALADEDAELEGDMAACWDLAENLLRDLPEDLGDPAQYDDPADFGDPLHGAINSTYGKALQTVLALGGWEHRRYGAAGAGLTRNLTAALGVGGAVGLQLRAVMATGRPFLETVATAWLSENFDELFARRESRITLDQTIKYSRPTRYFYDRALQPLLKATRRGTENALAWLLIAHLWEEPQYTYEAIIRGLSDSSEAIAEVGSEIARLGDDVPDDQREITDRALAFSEQLISDSQSTLPSSTLKGLGRWAMATHLDEQRWLELTEQVVDSTDGHIEFGIEVGDRCRNAQPSAAGLRILTKMLGRGDVWEQHHLDGVAAEALRSATRSRLEDIAVDRLRERLIQRGRYDLDDSE